MLPKIEYPKTEVKLLSTGKKVNIRPMTIREEKILLMARESDDRIDIIRAIKQILEACVEGSVEIGMLPLYEVEWLFMKLRAQSVSNVVKLFYTDPDSEEQVPFEINLDKVKPTLPEDQPQRNIAVNGSVGIHMRHTPVNALLEEGIDSSDDMLVNVIAGSIESVEEEGKKVDMGSKKEIAEWVQGLPSGTLQEMEDYLNAVPTLVHEEKIKLKDGKEQTVRLESIYDFFTL